MESNRWDSSESKEKKFWQSTISPAIQWISQKIRNIWNQIKAKPVLPALLFCFAIPSYWARENIAAAIQQANIDFTGAIWFGGLLLCAWLILLRTAKQPRPVQVMTAGAVSLLIFFCIAESIRFLIRHQTLSAKIWETGTFWTLAALLISSPVAFVVWRFRDENQSKDINLKEFQKISEWVTGAHFQEEKHSEKFSGGQNHQANMLLISERSGELYPLNDQSESPSERSREYYRPAASAQALHTFSKQDGAVGLQIAAVYNLLPFYRGDYGQAFEKPSVHLLHSAWKVLQHDILYAQEDSEESGMGISGNMSINRKMLYELMMHANSPLGQAITRVLLACDHNDKPLLHRHPEIFPGICLSGMNFELVGLKTEILCNTLFRNQDLNGAQLQGVSGLGIYSLMKVSLTGANLSRALLNDVDLSEVELDEVNLFAAHLNEANLSKAWLVKANLSRAGLTEANLSGACLDMANLSDASLSDADLSNADLSNADLSNADLSNADLSNADLSNADLSNADLSNADLSNADLSNADLSNADLSNARLFNADLSNTCLLHTTNLTIKQLLVAKTIKGSLIDEDSFSQYEPSEQEQLKEKGLIVLYKGEVNIPTNKHLVCRQETEEKWESKYPADFISFPIDLKKTQENNPDWEISIRSIR